MNEKKVLKGFNYAATSASGATITDSNGVVICEVQAGKQAYFTATTDTIDCGTEDVSIVEIRSNFNKPAATATPTNGGGGQTTDAGSRTFEYGMIVGIGPEDKYTDVGAILTYGGSLFYGDTTLTEWYGDMPVLTDAYGPGASNTSYGMFQHCTNLTSFRSNCPLLQDANQMFYECTNLVSFSGSFPDLRDGTFMFGFCNALSDLTMSFPKLVGGNHMFNHVAVVNLTKSLSVPKVEDGTSMFNGCTLLETVDFDAPSLTNGFFMFYNCPVLETVEGAYDSLTSAVEMFMYCPSLTSVYVETPVLQNGNGMYYDCTSLTHVVMDYQSLTSGDIMFHHCKLDKESLQLIVSDINTVNAGNITIGIDSTKITQEEQNAANAILAGKGWTVTWQRN